MMEKRHIEKRHLDVPLLAFAVYVVPALSARYSHG
jgi:hypothetical protein